jgi:TniQ
MIDIERLLANELPFPPRSVCFPLEPKAAETPRMESLRSYAIRLSAEHNLSATRLLSELVAPLKRQDDLAKLVPSWYSMKKALSAGLNELTMRTDLDKLTMLPWENVMASEGLYFPTMRWCPECVGEDGRRGDAYEHLLWNIGCNKACPYHKGLLREACPHCGSKLARDTTRNVQKRCPIRACRADLRKPMDGTPTEKDIYVAGNIGRVIADGYQGKSAQPDRLQQVWDRLVFPLFDSKVDAAHHLGLTEGLIYQSGTYTTRLKLKHWAQLSWMLGVSLSDLLLKEIAQIKPHLRPAETGQSKPRVTKRELRNKAFTVARQRKGKKLSVRRLAVEMGVCTTRLRKQLPRMTRGLSQERRKDMAKAREKKITLLIQLAHRAKSEGFPLSKRAAQRELKCRSGDYFEGLLAEASRRLNGEYFAF